MVLGYAQEDWYDEPGIPVGGRLLKNRGVSCCANNYEGSRI